METNKKSSSKVLIVTYGEVQGLLEDNNSLVTFAINATLGLAKELAKEFVKVIPDDMEPYVQDIDDWKGDGPFVLYHEDDDHFYFSATLVGGSLTGPQTDAVVDFQKFVDQNDADPDR